MCDVPSTAAFCSESIECFPGTASKFFLKLLVTIPVAPIITGIIVHSRFHILCISIHKLLYFNFFSALHLHLLLLLLLLLLIIIIIIITININVLYKVIVHQFGYLLRVPTRICIEHLAIESSLFKAKQRTLTLCSSGR